MAEPEPRLFTVEEANRLVPTLEQLTTELRERMHEYKFAAEQVRDLRRIHGDAVREGDHPEYAEFRRHAKTVRENRKAIDALLANFAELGCELKDPVLGLVDLHARHRDGDVVYLCWKSGEERIEYWHTLTGGFAGRRPVSEL